ncbi:twin transmembrane helix small protein [Brevundimonas sp. VNH65]|uniref:twin transmembrane helix small protein n=1 Tax=Brevundimonas sp. VNH65 TaxID=3400917 RepID=UPI003C12AB9A
MALFFGITIPLAMLAVVLTMGFGVYTLYRGGEFGRTWSNRLMRWRVLFQAAAVILLLAFVAWKRSVAG